MPISQVEIGGRLVSVVTFMEERMPIGIFSNISSLNAQRNLSGSGSLLSSSLARIASGLRINNSRDDAAGLAIATQLNSDATTLQQGAKNLSDAMSLAKIADGSLSEQSQIVVRLKELAEQSVTGLVNQNQRDSIQLEFSSLVKELDRIAKTTAVNGQNLLDGSLSASAPNQVVIQIGIDSSASNRINLNTSADINSTTADALGLSNLSVNSQAGSLAALPAITTALNTLSVTRAKVGATENRFGHALSNQNVSTQNLMSAESQIRNADMASELTTLTKNQILVNAGTAMVGQANLDPQRALRLLG